jgi:hypothetical protein
MRRLPSSRSLGSSSRPALRLGDGLDDRRRRNGRFAKRRPGDVLGGNGLLELVLAVAFAALLIARFRGTRRAYA